MLMLAISSWLRLLLSGVGCFLASWIRIPAPNLTWLPLGVGAPEISPLLLLGNGVMLLLTFLPGKAPLRPIALAVSLVALLLSSLPLVQLPGTLKLAHSRMAAVLGPQYRSLQPPIASGAMRPQPFVLTDLMRGIAIPQILPERTSFTAADGSSLQVEIYRTGTREARPTIVSLYGGAWQRGKPGDTARFNRYMAGQGYTVAAIDYRHAPQAQFPAQLQDVQAALKFLQQNAALYGIDCERLALVGWSAGGHLALLTAYQPGAFPVRAVVSYYGPINLTAGYTDPPQPDPIDTRRVLETFLGGTPEQLPAVYQQASPISLVRSGLPPTLLLHGQRDHLVKVDFAQSLYTRLQAANNPAVLIALPWAEHAFDAVFPGLGNQIALYYTERFLAYWLAQ